MPTTIIHSSTVSAEARSLLVKTFEAELTDKGDCFVVHHDSPVDQETLITLRQRLTVDINTLPETFQANDVALFITDMDSTLISIECVDEIADFLGIKHKVSEITESAMRGEIDFNTSLEKRVKLLSGLDYGVLEKVYQERLTLNPGAEKLISGLRAAGIKTALVSGGFTYFTDRLRDRLKFDFTLSNTLEVKDGCLTGAVLGNIVNGSVKAGFLKQLAEQLNIEFNRTIAAGDGANDLLMMGQAGLGVAYHAKPKVQQQADVVLNYSGLDAILHFLDTSNS